MKAGNILISAQGDVQLADFGVAGTLLEQGDRKNSCVRSVIYLFIYVVEVVGTNARVHSNMETQLAH